MKQPPQAMTAALPPRASLATEETAEVFIRGVGEYNPTSTQVRPSAAPAIPAAVFDKLGQTTHLPIGRGRGPRSPPRRLSMFVRVRAPRPVRGSAVPPDPLRYCFSRGRPGVIAE